MTVAPLHSPLQRAVTRLIYGQWAQPAEVLGATARRLTDATDVPALLATLVTDLSRALKLSHVEIRGCDGSVLTTVGPRATVVDESPLAAYGSPVGSFRWASDRPLRERDRHLIDDVVHTAGLVEGLRDAQRGLIVACEEERRRLRRDLHDGLGPELGSLSLKVDELRNRWPTLESPDAGLLELRAAVQGSIASVRRVVEGLRPAPLDELGLALALEHLALRGPPAVEIVVDVDPLPPLPAAVEVDVYAIAEEALANACRHSGAARITVGLIVGHSSLRLEVGDDGRDGGLGLSTMRERAEELGGRLTIADHAGGGTVVRLDLPITPTTKDSP